MKLCIIGAMCVAVLLTGSLSADTYFTEAVSNFWSDAGNWDNGIPDETQKVKGQPNTLNILDYDAGLVLHIALEGDGGPRQLRLIDGAALSVSNWVIIGYAEGTPEEPHLLEVLGGELTSQVRMKIGFNGSGKLVVDHGGIVNVLSQEFDIAENANSHGAVELRGGSLNLLTDSGTPLRFARNGNASASMDFSGGILRMAYSDAILANVNDRIADGSITAYGGIGTVVVDTGDANDYVHVTGLHPLNPGPQDGITVAAGSATLSWTLPDPCVPGQQVPVDVYFTDDLQQLQNFTNVDDMQLLSQANATSVSVQVENKKRYYWAVDTYLGGDDPNDNPLWGPIFEFYVDNTKPEVDAGEDETTWLVEGMADVALHGTVSDDGLINPVPTVAWTVVSEPDDPNSPPAVIANADQIDATVTLSALGTYVLQLEADDGEYTNADVITINVFENSCLAAQSLPGYEPIPGDLNGDCIVDQADIDLLLEQWLNCNGLDCPEIDPVDPNLPS